MMDLIPFLNMRKLVLGTSKSINPRHIFTCNLWCLICLHEQPFFVISLNSLSFTCVCNILWWIGNWDLARKGNGIADKNFKMHWSPMTLRSHAMKRIEVMNDQMIGSSSPLIITVQCLQGCKINPKQTMTPLLEYVSNQKTLFNYNILTQSEPSQRG
jgi:hypothetical protein